MSQVHQFILTLFLLVSPVVLSQDISKEERQQLVTSIEFNIEQANLDVNRGNYFVAQDNLGKALEFAEKIDDKRYQGIIYTKMAKIHYTLGENDKAIS